MLKVGYLADAVAWSGDLYGMEPAEILEQRAELTLVGGHPIHDVRGELGGVAAAATVQDPAGDGQTCAEPSADHHCHSHG